MVLTVQVLQAFSCDMRVDLCRRKVAVSEQQLHDPEVCTTIQQVGGERMAQAVWRHFLVDARFLCIALDDVPEGLASHAVPTSGRKQVVGLTFQQNLHARAVDKISQPALRFIAEGYESLAITFTDDTQDTLVKIDL